MIDGASGRARADLSKDLELGARVALKTIRPEIASQPHSLTRFKREIQLARRVTHPNVCRMFDLGQHRPPAEAGCSDAIVTFLTMELLEGETLAARLRRVGRMSALEALPLVQQMTAALAAAHDVGVIHRDFKPGNVILAPAKSGGKDVRAVVTDFGLARAAADQTATENLQSSVTAGEHIFGTLAYMAPEQLEGRELTPATDVYALGLVAYEMLTGHRPFPGNPYDRLRKAAPSPRVHAPDLDPSWDSLVLRCLEPEPSARFATADESAQALARLTSTVCEQDKQALNALAGQLTAGDLREDLKRAKRETVSGRSPVGLGVVPVHSRQQRTPVLVPPLGKRWFVRMALMLAMAVAGVSIAWFAWNRTRPLPELDQVQLTTNSNESPVQSATLSPDGKYLAYSDLTGIHVKLLATGETQKTTLPEEFAITGAIWSVGDWFPDGTKFLAASFQHPAYGSPGPRSLWVFSMLGSPPRKLRDDAAGGSVSPDGSQIAFTSDWESLGIWGNLGDREVWLMGANGEAPHKLCRLDEDSRIYAAGMDRIGPPRIRWSPDGQRVAYLKRDPYKFETTIEGADLKGGSTRVILTDPRIFDFSWLPNGRIIFSRGEPGDNRTARWSGNLWEIKVDGRTGLPASTPRRISN